MNEPVVNSQVATDRLARRLPVSAETATGTAKGSQAVAHREVPSIEISACTAPATLARLSAHPDLDAFRPPDSQLRALVTIASEPGGCIATAVEAERGRLIGYAAFHRPSAIEPWGADRSGALIELGAVEVASGYRGMKLAEHLLSAGFSGGRYDDTVVFATLYRWHYDLERSKLGELGYRRMLERLYGSAGFTARDTTDPEIGAHAANRLMVRVGERADTAIVAEFERLRLATGNRW